MRHWQICGPFGGPGFEKLTADPNGPMPGTKKDWKQATRELCEAAVYPPDEKVDLARSLPRRHDRRLLGPSRRKCAGARPRSRISIPACTAARRADYYGATWIHVPAETELEFKFQGHPMTPLRWFLNGQPLEDGPYQGRARQRATGRPAKA